MRSIRHYRGTVLAAAVLAALLFAPGASGQSVGLTPGIVDIKFVPGQPVSFDLVFANQGDVPMQMHSNVTDWGYDANNEKTFPPAGTLPHSAANWLEVVPHEFTVEPGKTVKMKVVVTPPAKASGGYYCAVFAESTPVLAKEASKDQQAVFANFRLGALVMLTADKSEHYQLEVGAPKITPPTASKPLTVAVPLDNQSNTHVYARADLAVLDANQKLIAKAAVDQTRLLPAQKGELSLVSSVEMAPGEYTALVTVIYAGKLLKTQEAHFTVGEPQE